MRLADEFGGGDEVVLADDEGDGQSGVDEHLVGAAAVVGGRWSEDVLFAGRVEAPDLVVEGGKGRLRVGEVGGEGVTAKPAVAAFDAEGGLELADAVVGGAGIGAAEHERAGARGGEAEESGDRTSAHRLGDDVGAVDAEVFEEIDEVAAEGAAVVFTEGEGAAPATGVENGAAVALAEGGELAPPGEGVAARPVVEDDVVAIGVAVLLVVEAGAVKLGEGHRGSVRAWRVCVDTLLLRPAR